MYIHLLQHPYTSSGNDPFPHSEIISLLQGTSQQWLMTLQFSWTLTPFTSTEHILLIGPLLIVQATGLRDRWPCYSCGWGVAWWCHGGIHILVLVNILVNAGCALGGYWAGLATGKMCRMHAGETWLPWRTLRGNCEKKGRDLMILLDLLPFLMTRIHLYNKEGYTIKMWDVKYDFTLISIMAKSNTCSLYHYPYKV